MKTLALFAMLAATATTAGSAAARSSPACMYDAAFKLDIGRLVYASSFLGTVQTAKTLETMHAYDILHRTYAGQALEQIPPLSTPCTMSVFFKDALARGAIIRVAITRIAIEIAAFPLTKPATKLQWRAVYATAITGQAAGLRLASDLGLSFKVREFTSDLRTLKAMQKANG